MFGGYIGKNDAKGDFRVCSLLELSLNSWTAECPSGIPEDMYDMPSQLGSYLQVTITMLIAIYS